MHQHLGDLVSADPSGSRPGFHTDSGAFVGTQAAANRALEQLDLTGYAEHRNEVWPPERRGATRLSPYIRHGLINLPRVGHVAGTTGTERDQQRFRDELLWQEYARHLYARLGSRLARPLRFEPMSPEITAPAAEPDTDASFGHQMRCVELVTDELHTTGWITNQTRMWMASHWTVRNRWDWRSGEDWFFRHLLDGSRAANRMGWQWTAGTATGRPYGFARTQVERRAPGLCSGCELRTRCPIEQYPTPAEPVAIDPSAATGRPTPDDAAATAGPITDVIHATPDAVWITAESLGDDDPALLHWPQQPVWFIFDEPLLSRLNLSMKRLVFITERLAELGHERELRIWRGQPIEVLADTAVATTFTPVPGWHRITAAIDAAAVHPWPWLVRPGRQRLQSYRAWRSSI